MSFDHVWVKKADILKRVFTLNNGNNYLENKFRLTSMADISYLNMMAGGERPAGVIRTKF